MTTLKDIAEEAGVSIITVSRALSGKHRSKVSEETRSHVLRVAQELGYQPNIAARALRAQRTYQFALVVPYVHLSFIPDVVQAIQDVAMANGYSCLLYLTAFQRELEYQVFRSLVTKRVDGVIWLPGPTPVKELGDILRDMPVVQLLHKEMAEASAVLVDQQLGTYLATRHLLELGHTRIGSLMVLDRHGQQRLQGFRAAMQDTGIEPCETWIVPDSSWESAHATVRESIPSLNRTTALLCYSDLVAWGAMRAFQQHRIAIPGHISLIGFDDMQLSRNLDPPLTTVAVPKAEVGEQAMKLLLQRINGEQPEDSLLAPTLVARSSSGPPPRHM